jgi:TolB-like protein
MSSRNCLIKGLVLVAACAISGYGCAPLKQAVPEEQLTGPVPARVVLRGLDHTYDGKPKPAEVRTEPRGLNVKMTYDGKEEAPVDAGSYTVVATVQDNKYEGSAKASMAIAKAPQKITFEMLKPAIFGVADSSPGASASSGIPVSYTSSNTSVATIIGDQVHIIGSGTAVLTATQSGDANYFSAEPVQRTLTVNKAPVIVTLSNMEQTYDGKPKPATITTAPDGPPVKITYEGGEIVPINAGSYKVTASVQDANYMGSASGTMVIKKAPQRITFNALPAWTYGNETPYLLFATISSGFSASYISSDPAVAIINGNQVTIRSAGTTTITAMRTGDQNYLPADPVQQVLTVKKAPAWVALSGLDADYTFDGKPKRAMVTTSPEGLNVSITYNDSTIAPADAGHYRVLATVQDANYEGTATGTLTIKAAFQAIQFPVPQLRTLGDGSFDLPVFLSSGMTASLVSSDPSVASISGDKVTITGAGTTMITAFQPGNRNYQAAEPVKRLLVVRSKQPRIVVFPVENLSGRPTPLNEVRQAIIQGLIGKGAVVLNDAEMQKFMARHRVRYVGGIDSITSKAWKIEEGMEAVIITSVDQYEDSEVPKIAITCRLVTTGDTPYILWMENADLSGDDTPGLFGAGLIDQIGKLQDKAIKQLMGSLAAFYADKPARGRSDVPDSFKPKAAHENPFFVPDKTYTVAVMPFYNRSKSSRAGDVLALRFVSQLVKNKAFEVMEPGVVRQKLLNYRIIMPEGPSKADMKSFFINLDTDLILVGRLLDYQEGKLKMEFDIRVYEKKSGSTVWSSWSHNEGNDAVVIFDWKRVNNAGALASKMARSIVQEITSR